VADGEAGFGGVLNAFELMKNMIDAGAAGVHFEDQLAAVKKCGHMGGKVLVPTQEAIQKLRPRAWPPTCWACRPSCWPAPMPRPPIC
jgi:isocitrate lyase